MADRARRALSQKATLLAAFFPVFIPTQLVATWAIQRYGAKVVSSLQNCGTCIALLACPWAMRVGGHVGLATCFTTIGVFQSPLFPAISVLKRAWTADVEPARRAVLLRIMAAGGHVSGFIAALAVPWLATRYGWQRVPIVWGSVFGALAVVWHVCASDAPKTPVASVGPTASKGFNLSVFSVGSVRAAMFNHFASNNMGYVFMQWAPTLYTQVHGVPAAQIGKWLAIPNTVNVLGSFLIGAIESRCLSQGMAVLRVRQLFTRWGSTLSALLCALFVYAPSAPLASLVHCVTQLAMCYTGSSFSSNYYEIGGKQTAIITGVANVFASMPGFFLPPLGAALFARFGLKPVFFWSSAVMLYSGDVYCRHLSVEPAEDALAARDRERASKRV